MFLKVYCCMSFIAATRAEGGLVNDQKGDILTGSLKMTVRSHSPPEYP